jgi:hypothetical protein
MASKFIIALVTGHSLLVFGYSGDVLARQRVNALPIVTRVAPASEATLFRKPSVVLMGRISESCDVENITDLEPILGKPEPIVRRYGVSQALAILVNERSSNDPDLSQDSQFHFRPIDNSAQLSVGHTYILLLDIYKTIHSAVFRVAHSQIGLEAVVQAGSVRVKPIVRGGELDQFDGRLLDDVIKEIQTRK